MADQIEPHPAVSKVTSFVDWASNANDSLNISLVQPRSGAEESAKPLSEISFKPEFTYPIYGNHETIFGYKDLAIKLDFASGSLRPFLSMSSTSTYVPAGSSASSDATQPDDVLETLKEYLPKDISTNYDQFVDIVNRDYRSFKPFGEKINEYSQERDDGSIEQFEIYKSSLSNPNVKEYHTRMQLFVLLFIEGSSYIDADDEKWELYTVYKREKVDGLNVYHFMGYCTAYPFYCWPENIRMRISQFLMLPPYKRKGHGSKLYQTLYQIFKSRPEVCEITVEDPNEEFADMRDKNDLRNLVGHAAFKDLKAPVSEETIEELRKSYKLTNRQLQRCMEIYLLSNLNKLNEEDYKSYRLQVKKRLYLFNYDVLRDLEDAERIQKLDETYLSVEDDYHRILEMI